jgi:predicted transcriptional regulator
MARPPATQPTEVELQILQILWDSGPVTARQIHNALTAARDTNYSTTVKMLSVMLEKGLVRRDESARPLTYRAAATRRTTQRRVVEELIRKLYDGSAGSLVLHALASKNASREDLAEIRKLLDQLEGRKP